MGNDKSVTDSVSAKLNDQFAEKMIERRKIVQLTRAQIEQINRNIIDFKKRDQARPSDNPGGK